MKLIGASKGTVRGFASEGEFRADLSGASRLSGEIQAAHTDLKLSGTARSRTSGEYLVDLFITPSSQEMESPVNPGRFKWET